MSKRNNTLILIQTLWPILATLIICQSIVITWGGDSNQVSAWLSVLPMLMTLILSMGGTAFGGPLIAKKLDGSTQTEQKDV